MNIEKYNFLKEYIKNYDAKLLVVTKNQSIETIKDLINLGHKEFGENRVQEANSLVYHPEILLCPRPPSIP